MCASMALALWLSSTAAPGARSLRVDADGALACDAEGPVRSALSEWTAEPSSDPSPAHLTLRSPTPTLLVLDLADPSSGAEVHRELPLAPADCADVGATVALLVTTWMQELPPPVELPSIPAPTPPLLSAQRPRRRSPSVPTPSEDLQVAPLVDRAPPDAGPPPAASAPPPAVPAEPNSGSASAPPRPRLELRAGLGPAWNAASSSLVPHLDVSGAWRFGDHLSLGIDLGAWWAIQATADGGTVQAAIQSVLVPVGFALRADGIGPRFEVAPGLDHVAVSSSGLPTTRSASLWDAALTVAGGWRVPVGSKGAFLGADVVCGVRNHTEILTIDHVGDALRLSPVWVMARVEVGWRLLSPD